MEIQGINSTPNPSAIILVVGSVLTKKFESKEFQSVKNEHPHFANEILEFKEIDSVMIQENQITLKLKDLDWENQTQLLKEVAKPVRDHSPAVIEDNNNLEEINPKLELVKEVLEEEILPYLKSHGGDISIIELNEEDELFIEYKGACGGCPAAFSGTLKAIQGLLQKEVDSNISVKLKEFPF